MCGRYVLPEVEQIKELVPVEDQLPLLAPMFNVAPSARMPVITHKDTYKITLMEWGFVPHWATNPKYRPLINARAETISEKPYFKQSFENRRCIIPATGFYEWHRQTKQPYYIHLSDQPIFGFAGIYDVREDAEGHPYGNFAIITTAANAKVAEIHNRMPVILHRENLLAWMHQEPQEAAKQLVPYDTDQTIIKPVSKSVNNPSVNESSLLKVI